VNDPLKWLLIAGGGPIVGLVIVAVLAGRPLDLIVPRRQPSARDLDDLIAYLKTLD
jgi:hypothetical protein